MVKSARTGHPKEGGGFAKGARVRWLNKRNRNRREGRQAIRGVYTQQALWDTKTEATVVDGVEIVAPGGWGGKPAGGTGQERRGVVRF